jgi:hypothetical protein
VPPRAAADRDRPGPPGPDASRRARHGQPGADAGPADPRYPNQTWPLPRVSMQVPDGKPGSQPTDYPANYPAGPGMGES